jgi:hypothetical protein
MKMQPFATALAGTTSGTVDLGDPHERAGLPHEGVGSLRNDLHTHGIKLRDG